MFKLKNTIRLEQVLAFGLVAFFLLLVPLMVFAQATTGSGDPADSNFQIVPCSGLDCDFADLVIMVNRIIQFAVYIAIPLAAVSFAYAGWLYVVSGGNESKINEAKGIFKKVLIGLIIVLGAWFFIDFLVEQLIDPRATGLDPLPG